MSRLLYNSDTGSLWRRFEPLNTGPKNLLTDLNGDACCCAGCGCCHCERPVGVHCCFGADDTLTFSFAMDAITWHTEACQDDESTNGTTCNGVATSGGFDFVSCDGLYVAWVRQAGADPCLPLWVFQPCLLGNTWILIDDQGAEWSLGECMDCQTSNNIPQLCTNIAVCPLIPDCCRPGGSGDPLVPVHEFEDCCVVVDPNDCTGIRIENWCFVCNYEGGGVWSEVCAHYFWEATVNFNTCQWNDTAYRCECIQPGLGI